MIRAATPLPPFETVGVTDAPLPEAAVEALAALLLEMVDTDRNQSDC